MNISFYPFYLVFYDLSPDLMYNEYYSRTKDRLNPQDFSANGKDLLEIGFRAIELPYGSVTFTANDPQTYVSFTYISMPGMCQTEILFSRSSNDRYVLTPRSQNFFQIGNYDDKCLIFIPPTGAKIIFSQDSSDPDDQIFVYSGYQNYSVYTGSFTSQEFEYSENQSALIRLLMNSDKPPNQISIEFDPDRPYKPHESKIFIPRHKDPECEQIDHWYSKELVITLIACSVFFAILTTFILVCKFKQSCNKHMVPITLNNIH